MYSKFRFILVMFSVTFFTICQAQETIKDKSDFPVLTDSNLGQKPPEMKPEIFTPELVSTKEYIEFGCSFSPDGKEFYFSRTVDDSGKIYVMKLEGNNRHYG